MAATAEGGSGDFERESAQGDGDDRAVATDGAEAEAVVRGAAGRRGIRGRDLGQVSAAVTWRLVTVPTALVAVMETP